MQLELSTSAPPSAPGGGGPQHGSTFKFLLALLIVIGVQVSLYIATSSTSVAPHGNVPTFATDAVTSATTGTIFEMVKKREYTGSREREPFHPFALVVEGGCSSKQWVVITSFNDVPTLIRQLAQPELGAWCTVVVADKKSPSHHAYQPPGNMIYLTPDMQLNLPYKVLHVIPWNHFGRKAIGYLYAIHNGAQVIYETNDDNDLSEMTTIYETVVATTSHRFLNPYPYFGAAEGWPRGLPDAIYRMLPFLLPFNFDRKGTLMVLPQGVVAPYNAQSTIVYRDCFWSLLLPITVPGRVSDIWRSYFTQRLMLEMGHSMASPCVTQIRNVSNYLKDFQAEQPLYLKTQALVKYLLEEWSSPSIFLQDLIIDLAIDMYEHGILEENDVLLTQAWISDLSSIRYNFPDTEALEWLWK